MMPPKCQKKRRREGGGRGQGEGSSPPPSPALKRRPLDPEIRDDSHLQEIANSCVQAAHMLNAASRRLEEMAKALTSNLYRVPGARIEQNLTPTYKLSFVNSLSDHIFTKREIRAADGALIKIAITGSDSNQQVSNSPCLLSARAKVVVLDGDFNADNHDGWTSEEFCNHIVRPRDRVGVVLTGDLELKLKNGEAYLENATFGDNSRFTRSGKFRLGVMLIDNNTGERVQEGITEPFVVKDRRGEEYKKRKIPRLDDEVWRLQRIAKGGVFHKALKRSGIHTVKHFLSLYYRDEKALRNILRNAPQLVWTTIVDHAKKCDPGRALYSHFIKDKDIRLYFSSVGQIVGATIANQYNAFDDVYLTQNKALLEQWNKDACECMTRNPDYEMHNSAPRPIDCSDFQGSIMPGSKSTEPTDKIIHETDQQDSSNDNNFSGSLPQQWPVQSAHQNNDVTDESFDETSLALGQGALTMDQGSYPMTLENNGSSLFQWRQEQPPASQCASPISQSIQSEPPHLLMENSLGDTNIHDILMNNWDPNQLWQNILVDDDIAQFFSSPNVSMLSADVGCSMTKLASCRRWLKLATLLKSMATLRACRSKARS